LGACARGRWPGSHNYRRSRNRLGPAKEVIQVGAVIGSEFSYDLLRTVFPIAEQDLQHALLKLADAEMLYLHGIVPDATYQFKHALIRDAAYEALLKTRRKELHLVVARTIDERFPVIKQAHPEVLARHWTEAGETDSAIAEWSRAGKAAQAGNAFSEAQESYQQAIALLNLLPESPERDLRELELRRSIVSMLQMTKGWAAPETVDAAERIAALAEKSGNLTHLGNALGAQGFTALVSGDLSTAGALADQALGLVLREGNPAALASQYLLELMVGYCRGDLAGAEQHFTTGLKFFDDPGFRRISTGTAVAAFGYGSLNAWTLGRADVARERMARMMAVVNTHNPHDAAFSRVFAARLLVFMREYERAESLAAQGSNYRRQINFRTRQQWPDGLSA
jgi:tetratricopeptide (TPR) repeat protein